MNRSFCWYIVLTLCFRVRRIHFTCWTVWFLLLCFGFVNRCGGRSSSFLFIKFLLPSSRTPMELFLLCGSFFISVLSDSRSYMSSRSRLFFLFSLFHFGSTFCNSFASLLLLFLPPNGSV